MRLANGRPDRVRIAVFAVMIAAGVLAGCGGPSREAPVELRTAPLTTGTIVGGWGTSDHSLEIVMVQCPWSARLAAPVARCSVPAGYVLVGGGAEIEGEGPELPGGRGPNPGALLTGSVPFSDLKTWQATSKDHLWSYPHRLRAYALGMRVGRDGTFINEDSLRSQMYTEWNMDDWATGHHSLGVSPSTNPNWRSDDIIVGGGVTMGAGGAGQLLTGSWPLISNSRAIMWGAESKDHGIASSTFLEVGVIAMRRCIAGSRCFVTFASAGGTVMPSGYWSAAQASNEELLPLTSVGGKGDYNGAGRLLTQLMPYVDEDNFGGASVTNKDHGWADTGMLMAHAIFVF